MKPGSGNFRYFDRFGGRIGTLEKLLYYAFLAGWIVAFALFTVKKITVYDTWWHLAAGKYIVENVGVPDADPFAYTTEGLRWVDVAWLYQVLLYGVYSLFGYGGIVAFKVITLFAAFAVTLYSMSRITSGRFLPVAVLWCIVIAISFRFTCRPQTFAYLLFSLGWLCLLRFWETPSWKWIAASAFVTLLWANMHASFILAPVLFSLPLVAECLASRKDQVRDIISRRSFRLKAALLLASLVSTLLTPHGVELYFQVIPRESEAVQEAMRHIMEWRRISPAYFFTFNWDNSLFFKIFAWAVVALLVFRIRERRDTSVFVWAFFAGLMFYLVLKYYRLVSFASFGLAPLCAVLVEGRLVPGDVSTYRSRIYGKPLKAISVATIVLCAVFTLHQIRSGRLTSEAMGFGVNWQRYPVTLVKIIREKHLSGPMLNTYGWGGFLIWHLYPEHRVFIDGRLHNVYDPELFWVLRAAEAGKKAALREIIERWRVRLAVTASPVICKNLKEEFRFRVVGFDHLGFLLVSEDNLPEGLKPFEAFNPCENPKKQIADAKNRQDNSLDEIKAEILRAIDETPSYRAYELAGMLFAKGYGNYEKAYEYYSRALNIAGDSNLSLLFNTASAAFESGRYDESSRLLEKFLRYNKSSPEAWLLMAKICYHRGRYEEALKAIKRHMILVGDIGSSEAYIYTGMIRNELYELDKAIKAFQRALLTATSEEERKIALYNLGRCYQALNKPTEAKAFFERALEIDPGFAEAARALEEVEKAVKREEVSR